ncbi:transposase, IS51 group, partial [Serratia symbiotica str. Tucson]
CKTIRSSIYLVSLKIYLFAG